MKHTFLQKLKSSVGAFMLVAMVFNIAFPGQVVQAAGPNNLTIRVCSDPNRNNICDDGERLDGVSVTLRQTDQDDMHHRTSSRGEVNESVYPEPSVTITVDSGDVAQRMMVLGIHQVEGEYTKTLSFEQQANGSIIDFAFRGPQTTPTEEAGEGETPSDEENQEETQDGETTDGETEEPGEENQEGEDTPTEEPTPTTGIGTFSNYVFYDAGNNGGPFVPVQIDNNAPDEALGGIPVSLQREGQDPIVVTTDESGRYTFENLAAGEYRLFVDPVHYGAAASRRGGFANAPANQAIRVTVGGNQTITVAEDGTILTPITSMGFYWVAQVTTDLRGSIFYNSDNSGDIFNIAHPSDRLLGGVRVILRGTDSLGNTVEIPATSQFVDDGVVHSSDGVYFIPNVPVGSYEVTVDPTCFEAPRCGSDTGFGFPATGEITSSPSNLPLRVTVHADGSVTSSGNGQGPRLAQMGFYWEPQAGGPIQRTNVFSNVFFDADNNGRYNVNGGDYMLGAVPMIMTFPDDAPDALIATATTSNNGLYNLSVNNIAPGTYSVRVNPDAIANHEGVFATAENVRVTTPPTSQRAIVNADGSLVQPTYLGLYWANTSEVFGTIRGQVFYDSGNNGGVWIPNSADQLLEGIGVNLISVTNPDFVIPTAYTDYRGTYVLPNLPAGDYRLEISSACVSTRCGDFADVPSDRYIRLTTNNHVQTFTVTEFGQVRNTTPGVLNSASGASQFGFFWATDNTADVYGQVFFDANRDGVFTRNSGDRLLRGIEVYLVGTATTTLPVEQTTRTILLSQNGQVTSDGIYFFRNVPPGQYTVRIHQSCIADHCGDFSLAPELETITPTTLPIQTIIVGNDGQITNGTTNGRTLVPFGFTWEVPRYSVSGVVFHDVDGDGIQDASENGLNEVRVEVTEESTGETHQLITNEQGVYNTDVVAGNVTIHIVENSAAIQALGDSPVISTTGNGGTNPQTLTNVQSNTEAAAVGFHIEREIAHLQGLVFEDANRNGVYDQGELGSLRYYVRLSSAVHPDGSAVEDAEPMFGFIIYSFENIDITENATYTASLVDLPENFVYTTDTTVTLQPGNNTLNIGFAENTPGGSTDPVTADFSGYVFFDMNRNGGVLTLEEDDRPLGNVRLVLRNTETNAEFEAISQYNPRNSDQTTWGRYGFQNVPAGEYTLHVDQSTLQTPPAYMQLVETTGTDGQIIVVTPEGTVQNRDGGNGPLQIGYSWIGAPYTIHSHVYYDANGDGSLFSFGSDDILLGGVRMQLINQENPDDIHTATTRFIDDGLQHNSDGFYSMVELSPGVYTLRIDPTCFTNPESCGVERGFGLAPEGSEIRVTFPAQEQIITIHEDGRVENHTVPNFPGAIQFGVHWTSNEEPDDENNGENNGNNGGNSNPGGGNNGGGSTDPDDNNNGGTTDDEEDNNDRSAPGGGGSSGGSSSGGNGSSGSGSGGSVGGGSPTPTPDNGQSGNVINDPVFGGGGYSDSDSSNSGGLSNPGSDSSNDPQNNEPHEPTFGGGGYAGEHGGDDEEGGTLPETGVNIFWQMLAGIAILTGVSASEIRKKLQKNSAQSK